MLRNEVPRSVATKWLLLIEIIYKYKTGDLSHPVGGAFTWGLSEGFDIKCAPGCGDFCVFGTPKKQIPHIAPRWGGGGRCRGIRWLLHKQHALL